MSIIKRGFVDERRITYHSVTLDSLKHIKFEDWKFIGTLRVI